MKKKTYFDKYWITEKIKNIVEITNSYEENNKIK